MKQDERIKCINYKCEEFGKRIRCYTLHYELCELYPQEQEHKDLSSLMEDKGRIDDSF